MLVERRDPITQAVASLDRPSASERAEGIRTLGSISGEKADRALMEAVQHAVKDVRVRAALSLAKRGAIVSDRLFEALDSNDDEDRLAAAAILSQHGLGNASADQVFMALRNEPNVIARLHLIQALKRGNVDHIDIDHLLAVRRQERERQVRFALVELLGQTKRSEAVPVRISDLQQFDDPDPRAAAAKALVCIGAAAVSQLAPLLRSHHSLIRDKASNVLAKIPEGLTALEETLAEGSADHAATAAYALASMGAPAVPSLLSALRQRVDLRGVVTNALGRNKAALASLLELLRDSDVEIQVAALTALGELREIAAIPQLGGYAADGRRS